MRKISILFSLIIFYSSSLFSQDFNYNVGIIPDSLKKGADVILRNNSTELIIIDNSKAYLKIKEARTILKKSGEKYADLYVPYNSFYKIKALSGKIYDKNGKLVKSLKKKDIYDFAQHDGFSLYSDNRLKAVRKPALNPPYTVEYQFEYVMKGILSFPSWNPVPSYKIAVQNAKFSITSDNPDLFRIMKFNFDGEYSDMISYEQNNNKLNWTAKNIKAVDSEDYNKSIKNIVPYLLIAPNDFKIDDYTGNAETWENFGFWINKLNTGRNSLSDETVAKIKELTKDLNSEYEKVKAVYEYMQNRTRYVNIALGIGGWQPFPAEETDLNGYGDCKGLTYYTKSLLETIDIKSDYVIANAGPDAQNLKVDFPSNQFNHAFLCVPIKNDTVWLECTSQKSPFGYLGTFTDDRDVLIIDSNGKGKIAHTFAYAENINTLVRKANVIIDETGNITSKIKTVYSGIQYENVRRILDLSDEEKEKKLNNKIALPGMKIKSFSFKNNKNRIPSAEENIVMNVKGYASVSSNRMFLVPDLMNKKEIIPEKLKKRKTNIIIRRGYTDIDTIVYKIPENYVVEFIPEDIKKNNQFGNYEIIYKFKESTLTYIRKLIMHKGTFPTEDYTNFRNFFKFIATSDKQTCVFKIKDN